VIGGCREYTGAPYFSAFSALKMVWTKLLIHCKIFVVASLFFPAKSWWCIQQFLNILYDTSQQRQLTSELCATFQNSCESRPSSFEVWSLAMSSLQPRSVLHAGGRPCTCFLHCRSSYSNKELQPRVDCPSSSPWIIWHWVCQDSWNLCCWICIKGLLNHGPFTIHM